MKIEYGISLGSSEEEWAEFYEWSEDFKEISDWFCEHKLLPRIGEDIMDVWRVVEINYNNGVSIQLRNISDEI